MAEAPFLKAIQRVADDNALLLPAERAVRIRLPLTIRRVPETDADGTLSGSSSSPGEVSGYYELGLDSSLLPGLITSRIVFATSPLRVNGGASADLGAVNITLSINPATTSDPGSLSASDKQKLDSLTAGAAIADVLGSPPIVVVGTTVKTVSISPAGPASAGSMSSTHYNLLNNLLTAVTPTTIEPDDVADTGVQNFAARTDHKHAIASAPAGVIQVGDSASEGASTAFSRADHVHTLPPPAAPTTIQPDDAASAGAATTVARADHRHAVSSAAAGSILIGDAAAEGVSTSFARADHTHAIAAPAAPAAVGAANSVGASTAAARADHVHADAWQALLGIGGITGTTTTRYVATGRDPGTASANPLDMPVRKAFKIDSLRMVARVGGTAGQTITAAIRKNGALAGGGSVLTTASDALTGANSFTPVSFADGDTWGLQIDKSGAIATSPTDITWAAGMTPP